MPLRKKIIFIFLFSFPILFLESKPPIFKPQLFAVSLGPSKPSSLERLEKKPSAFSETRNMTADSDVPHFSSFPKSKKGFTVSNYSIDPAGVNSATPSSVSSVDTLLRVFDAFVSIFLTTDEQNVSFHQLSKSQKVEVFKATKSLPSIQSEQIRIYYNFAFFCWKKMSECNSDEMDFSYH